MADHQVGDMVLGYLGYPNQKKEVLGVIKSLNDKNGLYNIEWMDDKVPPTNADEVNVDRYKKNLKRHLAKTSSR